MRQLAPRGKQVERNCLLIGGVKDRLAFAPSWLALAEKSFEKRRLESVHLESTDFRQRNVR
jgi:hypothetical protein